MSLPVLLSTKFNRPPVPEDFISRSTLFETLNQGLSKPLTLISAPAGYGKTTLASAWIEELDCPKSWLSLDRNDNNLDAFLAYFLSAIEAMFFDAGKQIRLNIAETDLQNPDRYFPGSDQRPGSKFQKISSSCWITILRSRNKPSMTCSPSC